MARVTVEDCLEQVDNRFELVMLASKRARQLATTGAEPMVDWENDKPTVVALREIAEGHTDFKDMSEEEPQDIAISFSEQFAQEAGDAGDSGNSGNATGGITLGFASNNNNNPPTL